MRVTRWTVLPLVPKALYKLGFFEGIVKSSKTIHQISRMIFKVALKQFCMNKTDGEQPYRQLHLSRVKKIQQSKFFLIRFSIEKLIANISIKLA